MNLSDIGAITRRPRRAKTLLERARKYIGSVTGPLKPRNVAATGGRSAVLTLRIVAVISVARSGGCDSGGRGRIVGRSCGVKR